MGGQSTVVRYVSMLPMSPEELQQAVRFEADKFLPFELDEVVLDCEQLEGPATDATDGTKVPVLVAACRRQLIEERVQTVEAAGLAPIAIDLDLFALANAWELCGLPEEELPEVDPASIPPAVALVDVGATRTSINVLRAGRTCFSREIALWGDDMTQAVARRLGIEPHEAEIVKCDGELHEAEVASSIAPVLEDLATSSPSPSTTWSTTRASRSASCSCPAAAPWQPAPPLRSSRPLAGRPAAGIPWRDCGSRQRAWTWTRWSSRPSLVVAVGLASRVRTR